MSQSETNTQPIIKDIVFIDTNYLISFCLFWDVCKRINEPLINANLANDIFRNNGIHPDSIDINQVKKGQALFQYLLENKDSFDFYSSKFCLTEVVHTYLEAKANENLLNCRIPFRMRKFGRGSGKIYLLSLSQSDYNETNDLIQNALQGLYDVEIPLKFIEEDEDYNSKEILQLAEKMMSKILIEVMDAIIYASSIKVMALKFITRDEALREVINKINNPSGDPEWQQVQNDLKVEFMNILDIKPDDFKLPIAIQP
jgi:hypothetical protein